mmetsp:Transcript_64179/g.184429  ORF Transcript_64179/g.184429 Transcript_64179/m.184429 type:complete len:130 (+) Transcript_64179:329-718(+)
MEHEACPVQDGLARAKVLHRTYNQQGNVTDRFIDRFSLRAIGYISNLLNACLVGIVSVETDGWYDKIDQSKESSKLDFCRKRVTSHSIQRCLDATKFYKFGLLSWCQGDVDQCPTTHRLKHFVFFKSLH